jgi:hypothetical protein
MIFDDLSLRAQILICIFVPPILTLICWFGGRRLLRAKDRPIVPQTKAGFWGLLLAAYLLTALALYSSRYFAGTERADPDVQLIQ